METDRYIPGMNWMLFRALEENCQLHCALIDQCETQTRATWMIKSCRYWRQILFVMSRKDAIHISWCLNLFGLSKWSKCLDKWNNWSLKQGQQAVCCEVTLCDFHSNGRCLVCNRCLNFDKLLTVCTCRKQFTCACWCSARFFINWLPYF